MDKELKDTIEIESLSAEELWKKIYGKELNTKKTILEYIEITKVMKKQNVACDNVVIAAGFVPDNSIYTKLEEETDMQVFNVGDAKRVRQIYDAVHEGYIAAKLIH